MRVEWSDADCLSPTFDVSRLVGPSGNPAFRTMMLLHYPTYICEESKRRFGYIKDISNTSLRLLHSKRGTLDDAFMFDIVPVRIQRD